MKLSSLDIRKQQFSRIVRGYDRDEVDAFLEMVGTQWQEMVDELRRANEKITEMQVQLEHYHKVEEALEEAITVARVSAEKKIEIAEKGAEAILEKAEARAISITIGAEEERLTVKRETARFSLHQKEMLTKFRAFLTSELEMLSFHEREDLAVAPEMDFAQLTEASVVDDETASITAHEHSENPQKPTIATQSKGAAPAEKDPVEVDRKSSKMRGKQKASRDRKDGAAADKEKTDSGDVESATTKNESSDKDGAEAAMSSDSINGDARDSLSEDKHKKPSWTVNTLVSPADGNAEKADSTDPVSEKNDEMLAAQEEIENLRKLLKELE